MQQEIHSYAYHLNEGYQGTNIGCHPSNPYFFISTSSLKQPYHSLLYTLEYDEENPRKSKLSHIQLQGKITAIYTFKENYLITLMKDNQYYIYKVDYPTGENQKPNMPQILSKQNQPIINIITTKSQTILCGQKSLNTLNLQNGLAIDSLININDKKITYSAVDPIHEYLAYVVDQKISITDKSCKKDKYVIEPRSNQKILSIDFNPNKQYYLMCAYFDSLKFYDIRKANLPVKCFEDHHSLILNARYNHSHDQLIISSYDDGTIGLWRITSVSSVPLAKDEDTLVKLYDEHEDAVYNVQWSYFSPWVFGTLGYTANNFVVNVVPSAQKYRILL